MHSVRQLASAVKTKLTRWKYYKISLHRKEYKYGLAYLFLFKLLLRNEGLKVSFFVFF